MSELKEVWSWLSRFGTEEDKKRFRPVYKYIQKLELKIKKLEGIIDEQMAPQFFEKKTKLQLDQEKERAIEEAIKRSRQKKEFVGESLKIRLQKMISEGKVGSTEWSRTLKWNGLTEVDAYELAKQ